jgi:hypothetical protein
MLTPKVHGPHARKYGSPENKYVLNSKKKHGVNREKHGCHSGKAWASLRKSAAFTHENAGNAQT